MGSAEEFWLWFAANESRFRNVEVPEKESLLDEILEHLHAYCDHLFFQTGGGPSGPHELVITAEGNPDYFQAIRGLVAAALPIPGWKIVALKQPGGLEFTTRHEGIDLNPKDLWYQRLFSKQAPEALGLRIACPGYDKSKSEEFTFACWTLLDCALGELAVAEGIQHVEACSLPGNPAQEGFIEMAKLPDYLEWRRRLKMGESES